MKAFCYIQLISMIPATSLRLLVNFAVVLFLHTSTCTADITYDIVKERLLNCQCFQSILKDANVGTSPKGVTLNTFHSAIDDIIASRRLKYNDLQQQKINRQKVKIGFKWGASEFADDAPPEGVAVADLNFDDTKEFIEKYDLPVTMSLKDGSSKEEVIQKIERSIRIARKERLNSYIGMPRGPDGVIEVKYIIIGAGPSGLQQAYFLERENRDYIVLEKEKEAGSFFGKFPRSRKMSSLNRKYVYGADEIDEISYRYDSNSLLSDDYSLKFSKYTLDQYPHADVYQQYLQDYGKKHNLKVEYNSEVIAIKRQHRKWQQSSKTKNLFLVSLRSGQKYRCRVLIVATGLKLENAMQYGGAVKFTDTYETVSLDARNYFKRRVLLLGNSQYLKQEIASNSMIYSSVSDINTNAFDPANHNISITQPSVGAYNVSIFLKTNQKLVKHGVFDDIVLCDNFQCDTSIYASNRTRPKLYQTEHSSGHYIGLNYDFSSRNVSHMYFAGALVQQPCHMRGAPHPYLEIGQWRYLSRALHRLLSIKYEQQTWQSMRKIPGHASAIVDRIKFRIAQAAGLFQMHQNSEVEKCGAINHALADLITVPLSGYFANNIRRGNALYFPEVSGLPDSAATVLLKLRKFHNKDMVLVRHFITLSFDSKPKPLNCHHTVRNMKNKSAAERGREEILPRFYARDIHPRVNLYSLPINESTRLLMRGKPKLLRVFHFDNTNANNDRDRGNLWSSTEQMDNLQNWIERVVFRIVSSGHLIPPAIANPPLEIGECVLK